MNSTLISGVTLLTGAKADVYISNGVISKIAPVSEECPRADAVLNGRGRLLMPGLVNSHTHAAMTLLRGYADGLPLDVWLNEKIFPIEDMFTPNDIYWGTMLGICEMISTGSTAFADMYSCMDKVAEAAGESGIKANLSRGLMCFGDDDGGRLDESLRLYNDYNGEFDGRLKVYFGPHSVYLTSPLYLRKTADAAKRLNTGIHVHLSETVKENDDCLKLHGKTPAALLDEAGIFDVKTIAAHCVHLSNSDIELLSDRDVTLAHCPSSNLKLGSGIFKLPENAKAAIGTDGASSNNNLNMFEEMHMASILSNGGAMNPTAISPQNALKMATEAGAAALSFPDTGVIEEGKRADLVLVDTTCPHMFPMHSALSNVLYSAGGGDVKTVICDGRILYHNNEFLTVDYERVKYNVGICLKRLF